MNHLPEVELNLQSQQFRCPILFLAIETVEIVATRRHLRATWTLETEQDIRVWNHEGLREAIEQDYARLFARQSISKCKINWTKEGF